MASTSVGTQTTVQDLHLLDSRSEVTIPAPAHSGRLVYANPEDLPSYPTLGLRKDDAAAGAAASLGWANARPLTLWTPETDRSAQRAATIANSYKMPALPQADRNPAGSKTAAVLAVLAAENANHRAPPDNRASMPASRWGNSAANQAFAASAAGNRVEPRAPMTDLNRQKSLRAAKGAFAGDGRARSTSSPLTYPDSANAAANALSAATMAHRPSNTINLRMTDVGAQPVTSLGSAMYTSHPPVRSEAVGKDHDEALHASAVVMAKRMFAIQQKNADTAAKQAHERDSRPGTAGTEAPQQPMQFTNLQEAAYNLAQERLARLEEEHQRNRGLSDYYGTSPTSPTSPGRRLTKSMGMGKLRRRASSDGDVAASLGDDDRQRSRQIRKQMSLFSHRLDQVDESKRSRDREALLAAAQRNVKATLDGMDDKMYRDQGRVPPSKLNEWETKAHTAAQARSDARTTDNMSGKVDLGAGQFMDREKVEEIAARRVQPVLDEINEKAELERQRIAAQREEQEKRRLEAEAEKAKNTAIKEDARRLKEEEKIRKGELKEEAKARKEDEKAAKAEEKRLAKEEKDRSKGAAIPANDGALPENAESSHEEATQHKHRLSRPFTPKLQTKTWPTNKSDNPDAAASPSQETSPESANESHSSRVRNWLKSRLQRPRARSSSGNNSNADATTTERPGAFIGGHALTRIQGDGTASLTSLSENDRSTSMRDVAMAGRPVSAMPLSNSAAVVVGDEEGEGSGTKRNAQDTANVDDASIRSLASKEGYSGAVPERDSPTTRLRLNLPAPLDLTMAADTPMPPPTIADPARVRSRSVGSPNRDSRFVEIID